MPLEGVAGSSYVGDRRVESPAVRRLTVNVLLDGYSRGAPDQDQVPEAHFEVLELLDQGVTRLAHVVASRPTDGLEGILRRLTGQGSPTPTANRTPPALISLACTIG
jgi:hypothetical protein